MEKDKDQKIQKLFKEQYYINQRILDLKKEKSSLENRLEKVDDEIFMFQLY